MQFLCYSRCPSSATTVMVVSFVNAGLMTLRQAIGVIMGANIGICRKDTKNK